MATKSKNNWTFLWSVLAIGVAVISIGYCFSHILELIESGYERSTRAISYMTRIMKGSASL